MIHWYSMKLFTGIDINDSFVLNWKQSNNTLEFEINANICPKSPYYEKPKENEFLYKKAILSFERLERVEGLVPLSEAEVSFGLNDERGYGEIDELLKTDSGYIICGNFGDIRIYGGNLHLSFITN